MNIGNSSVSVKSEVKISEGNVHFQKHGGYFTTSVIPEPTLSQILNELTFQEREMQFTYGKSNQIEFKTVRNYYQEDGRVCFPAGHFARVASIVSGAGLSYTWSPDPDAESSDHRCIPNWDHFLNHGRPINFREGQQEMINTLLSNHYGVVDSPPGFGKSFLVAMICRLLPEATIDIATKRATIANERLFPEIQAMVPSCGLVSGKTKKPGPRVNVVTLGCLGHRNGDADILIVDEVHEAVTDSYIAPLSVYANSRRYGLSASTDQRFDGKDYRVEALFGPVVYKVSFDWAVRNGLVVPIEVNWVDVDCDYDLIGNAESVKRKRLGIWQNQVRNDKIAETANQYDDDTQVLITVATVEHAVRLKALLPDFELVYAENGLDANDRYRYIQEGLIDDSEPEMTKERRENLAKRFGNGEIKKAIATTVWNVGVSFDALEVLIRGDGGASGINSIQIPGRVSRISEGKSVGIVHDFVDRFHSYFYKHSQKRAKQYEEYGFTRVLPGNRSEL